MNAFRWHGGRLAEARALYGDGTEPWIDLSTGINPLPWPGAASIAPEWQALPDPAELADLEAAAAAYFGVDPSHLCAVPGSEIGLRIVGQMIARPASYLLPSYRTHGEAFDQSIPMCEPEDAPVGTCLLLANPNNPDGRAFVPKRLVALMQRPDWLIIDEAFADCLPDHSMMKWVGEARRLIILRSFGKFFGLAGVRLGFVAGPPDIVAACRRLLGDWPVSAAAVAFGRRAYRDAPWIASTVRHLKDKADALDVLLARHGLPARGACPLFRLVETPDAAALFDRLARHAILTRPFESEPRWLRFGLPAGEAEMARLDAALADG
ncbi:MAG TPA: threonine-phosphate decarboxylase [Sphingobium sp.]|nr:threonine-phosphate decarboxylase [Sphingobium sp.]